MSLSEGETWDVTFRLLASMNDFKENKVVNLPDSPIIEIIFFSFFSGCPNKFKASLILFRPNLTDLLNSLWLASWL